MTNKQRDIANWLGYSISYVSEKKQSLIFINLFSMYKTNSDGPVAMEIVFTY